MWKTKAIFDIAKEEYVILLDFGGTTRAADIRILMDSIAHVAKTATNIHDICRDLVFRTFLARYYLLTYLIAAKEIQNPGDWLLFQLGEGIQDILMKIDRFLQQFDWNGMNEIFDTLRTWFRSNQLSMTIAIDEVNVLLQTLAKRFNDSLGNENTRPLSSLVIPTLSKSIGYTAPVIISGTHLRIVDRDLLGSHALNKPEITMYTSD
jgi:hypothetical protein